MTNRELDSKFTNDRSDESVAVALLLLFGFVLVCLLWFAITYTVDKEQKKELAEALTSTQNLARAFEEHTLRTIMSTDQMAMFLKHQYEKEGSSIDMSPYQSGGSLKLQPFVLLSVADANGDLIISNQNPFVPSNIYDREHFQVHTAEDSDQLFISKPVLGRSSGKWSIQMTRRINNPDGSFGGAVIVSVDPFYFTRFYQQLDLGKGASIALVGHDGIVRAWQSDKGSDVGRNLIQDNSALISRLSANKAGHYSAISTSDGIKRINSYRTLPDHPLAVVVGIAEDEVLSDFYQRRSRYYGIGIILTIFIFGVCGTLTYVLRERQRAESIRSALYSISEKASTSYNLEDLYRSVHTIIAGLIPAANFYIAIYDKETKMLHFPYRVDALDGNPGSRKLSKGLPEYIIRTGNPLFITSTQRDALESKNEIETYGSRAKVWMGVPLKSANNSVFGVMAVFAYKDGITYTKKDQEVLSFVSSQVAMAIERKQSEEAMRYLGTHDILTGLYNRAYFENELELLDKSEQTPIAIIMCDIDGLKLVNDTFGHSAGDRLLVTAASLLQRHLREDHIAARFGGDEFVIIMPGTTDTEARLMCEQINREVAAHNADNQGLPISISLGYGIKESGGTPLQTLLKEADNCMYREKLHHSSSVRSDIVRTVMKLQQERDSATDEHGERLLQLTEGLAAKINMPNSQITDLLLFAKFHDIGKIGIPDSILLKPGPLTPDERREMQRHSEIGHRIALSSADLQPIADWVLKHHEWWNGEGYPLGLSGENIPIQARILAITDAYDAMVSDRPYRKAQSMDKALAELQRYAGVQFDPVLVKLFTEMLQTDSSLRVTNDKTR